jgi:serine/threonine protein kinase/tetratricopeptide (TPR) repeat protein
VSRCPTCHRRLPEGASCPADGDTAPQQQPAPETLAPELHGYRLLRRLGGGGFATVWEAQPEGGGPTIAVKIGHASTARARARFAREAEVLGQLDRAYVPAIHGQGELPDGRPYLIQELLRSQPLAELLASLPGPPPSRWVHDVFTSLLASLEALHARGIVHGDLKPEHVFLDPPGPVTPGHLTPGHVSAAEPGEPRPLPAVRLIDFGLVDAEPRAAADTATAAGTVEYMAPEQFDGRIDPHTDIYAAGVILYEMLTLRVPFSGSRAQVEYGHRTLRPPAPASLAAVPDALAAVCLACLSKDPDERPPDVRALWQRFTAACAEAQAIPEAVPQGGTGPQYALESRSQRMLLGSSQLVVLLAADIERDDGGVDTVVTRHRGLVARQQGARYVCGFSGVDQAQPMDSAMAAAQGLMAAYGARVALHLAQLTVRRSRRGLRFFGVAVETPEHWLPPGPWRDLVLTQAFADALPAGAVRPSPDLAGFHRLATRGEQETGRVAGGPQVELIGRSAVLAAARASVDAARTQASPALFTVHGDNGLGKSRIAHELVERLGQWWPEARVVFARAQRTSREHAQRSLVTQLAQLGADRRTRDSSDVSGVVAGPGPGAQALGEALRAAATAGPLVVVLDDAHHAESSMLDAIEYATLDGEDMPLWVAVCAHSQMLRRRPRWGERAQRHDAIELGPMSEGDAMDLAAALLRPVEYTPAAALRQLAQWSGCNPQVLTALVQWLVRDGIVRQRAHGPTGPQGSIWYLDTARLTQLPASPAAQWLATRALEALLPALSACLQLCAVLGSELARDELAWVQDEMLRAGAASESVDPDVGLAELESRGFLARFQDEVWAFQQVAFQKALYVLVDPGDRARIHQAALAFWRTQPQHQERVLEALARHAMAVGARDQAAQAYRALGDRARAQHRDVDAEQHYSVALDFVAAADHAQRAHLLGARGRARYRLQRCAEAQTDLRAAQEHARALGDRRLEIALLLEEATALDWAERFTESAQQNQRAGAMLAELDDPVLRARHTAALGRSMFRKGQMHEAVEHLERAEALAVSCDDRETRVVALLLLGPSLVCMNQLAAAEQAFEQAIALCQAEGDRLHLCAAYSNRSFLWAARRSLSGLIADLRRTLELAREIGQPMAERVAAHNLAEYLHWSGKWSRALSLARRALALQRFLPEPVASDALLLARIHAALGDRAQAHTVLSSARSLLQKGIPPRSEELAMRMLELFLDQDHDAHERGPAWNELVAAAGTELPGEELLEIHYFRARAAADARQWQEAAAVVTEARRLLVEYPVWQDPFNELMRRVEAHRAG